MATITANIEINSDIMGSMPVAISEKATLTKAGSNTGLAETTGLARAKFETTTATDLITYANVVGITNGNACKVYIKNTSSDTSQYVQISIGNTGGTPIEVGRLYGGAGGNGDWMFFPWIGGTNEDIVVDPSTTDPVVLEYMIFFE